MFKKYGKKIQRLTILINLIMEETIKENIPDSLDSPNRMNSSNSLKMIKQQ